MSFWVCAQVVFGWRAASIHWNQVHTYGHVLAYTHTRKEHHATENKILNGMFFFNISSFLLLCCHSKHQNVLSKLRCMCVHCTSMHIAHAHKFTSLAPLNGWVCPCVCVSTTCDQFCSSLHLLLFVSLERISYEILRIYFNVYDQHDAVKSAHGVWKKIKYRQSS